MTSAPETERPESSEPSESPEAPAAESPPARQPLVLLAALTGILAVLCALVLPFAPVSVNEPTVSWPKDPARPESTLLNLTAYRPLALDATVTCAVARQVQAAGPTVPAGAVVLATVEPTWPLAVDEGLVVTVGGDRLQVRAMGRVLVDDPLAGACTYTITGRGTGLPEYQGATPDPLDPTVPDLTQLAGPDDAVLTVSRDGTELARATGPLLPSVDMLTTSATAVAPGALRVSIAVDDEFTSSPTFGKQVLIGLLVASLLATAVLLARVDRGTERPPRPRRFGRPRIVDAVVPVVIGFWTLVAPATDDDGYYAAMARNARISGEVGNYYQLYDQNFTPFTWFYYVLGWWQGVVGDAPVLQRLLAVAFGLLTWVLLRRFAADAMAEVAPDRPGVRSACHVVLAAVFLAWWLPQDMGVRPEGVVCVCAVAAMHAVLVAWRRERLAVAWLAFALAGLGFAAHPTGFTLLAPLLAGLPLLWRLVALPGDAAATALRVLAVVSGGMVAPLMAFVDGGLRDFLRGQRIFLSIQPQESWATEIQRYAFLLGQMPMGNYAKRAAVLLCLLSLVWFGVLAAAARMRRVQLPVALWFSGSTTALAFAALWLTPSKWTHHFGALAGVGTAFLALFLALAVPTVRSVLGMWRLPYGLVAAAAGSYVLAIALSWHGPNQWPYAWLDGVRRPTFTPAIKHVLLDSPLLWLLALVVVVGGLVVSGRVVGTRDPRLNVLRAVPILVVISLAFTTVYTVYTFGLAAVQGLPRASIWAQGLADPTASRCGAAAATEVLDPFTAVPLAEVPGLPAPPPATGFVNGGGYYAGNRPQGVAGERVWGSLVARDGASAERTEGEVTTPWYALPDAASGTVTVIAAGSLADGVRLTGRVRAAGRRRGRGGRYRGADRRRARPLVAHPGPGADGRRGPGAPGGGRRVRRDPRLAGVLGAGRRPAGGARRPPAPRRARRAGLAAGVRLALPAPARDRQRDHRAGRVRGAVGGAARCRVSRTGRSRPSRGGAFAQLSRSQSVLELATVEPVDPNVQVVVFGSPLGRDRYTLIENRRTESGTSRIGPRTRRKRPRCGGGSGMPSPSPYGRSVLSPPRPATPPADLGARGTLGRARLVLAVGLLTALAALAFPFAPVRQPEINYLWTPADGTAVALPLMPYQPVELTATIGCAAARTGGLLLSTVPPRPDPAALPLDGLRLVGTPAGVRITSGGRRPGHRGPADRRLHSRAGVRRDRHRRRAGRDPRAPASRRRPPGRRRDLHRSAHRHRHQRPARALADRRQPVPHDPVVLEDRSRRDLPRRARDPVRPARRRRPGASPRADPAARLVAAPSGRRRGDGAAGGVVGDRLGDRGRRVHRRHRPQPRRQRLRRQRLPLAQRPRGPVQLVLRAVPLVVDDLGRDAVDAAAVDPARAAVLVPGLPAAAAPAGQDRMTGQDRTGSGRSSQVDAVDRRPGLRHLVGAAGSGPAARAVGGGRHGADVPGGGAGRGHPPGAAAGRRC